MKILGLVNSSGDYQGHRYHNLVIHVSYVETNGNKDCKGELVDTIKLKYSDLNTLFNMGLADPSDVEKLGTDTFSYLIGKSIDVAYNKFGAVQSVQIYDTNTAEIIDKPQSAKK